MLVLYVVLLIFSFSVCFTSMSVRQSAERRIDLLNIGHVENLGRYLFCTRRKSQKNDFELILATKWKLNIS